MQQPMSAICSSAAALQVANQFTELNCTGSKRQYFRFLSMSNSRKFLLNLHIFLTFSLHEVNNWLDPTNLRSMCFMHAIILAIISYLAVTVMTKITVRIEGKKYSISKKIIYLVLKIISQLPHDWPPLRPRDCWCTILSLSHVYAFGWRRIRYWYLINCTQFSRLYMLQKSIQIWSIKEPTADVITHTHTHKYYSSW